MLETGVVPGAALAEQALARRIARSRDVLERLGLVQARLDVAARAAAEAEEAFVAVAGAWGAEKGVTWEAWRAVGVPAGVLARAGISPQNEPRDR